MANFTVNHVLANDPNSIGTPIAYVVDERYSEDIILTVSNITGTDASEISSIKVFDDGVYLGTMNSGAFWEQNKNYSLSIKSTDLSLSTEAHQLSFVAYDSNGNVLGEEYATIRTVDIPETIYKIKEVNYSYNDVKIVGDQDVFEVMMPQINSQLKFGEEKIGLADFFNIFSTGIRVLPVQTVVYDGYTVKEHSELETQLLVFGHELKGWEITDAKIELEDLPLPSFLNGSTIAGEYTAPSDLTISISNSFTNKDGEKEAEFERDIPTAIPGVKVELEIEAEAEGEGEFGWELKLVSSKIQGSKEREIAGSFAIKAGLEVRAGVEVGIGLGRYEASLVEAGFYGSGEVAGTLSYSSVDSWSGDLSFTVSAGLFLDALTLEVGNFDFKLYSMKYELLSYDANFQFIGEKVNENVRDRASSSKAAVNFFMKDGIGCKQRGDEFTFSVNLEANNLLHVLNAMEKNGNLNYNVVLRYAEIKEDGSYGERQEEFVDKFNATTCAVMQKTLILDENKNYAYSFVLIPESQKETNLDFVSSSEVFYTKPTLTVEKITAREPSTDPNITAFENATFTVKLSRAVDYDIKLGWFAGGGNATEGVDYNADSSSEHIVIKAGETEATFTVKVLGDTEDEADENFYVQMYAFGDAADKVVFSSENLMADSDSNWGYSECIIKDSNSVGTAAVTVLDISGSMSGSMMTGAKNAAISFVNNMTVGDYIGVVSFDEDAYTNYSLTQITGASEKNAAISAINGLYPYGGTFIGSGIQMAGDMLKGLTADCDKYIIAMTDGIDWYPEQTTQIVNNLPDDIIVNTIGFGAGSMAAVEALSDVSISTSYAQKSLMEEIAEMTGGKYYYAANEEELQNIYFDLSTRSSNQQLICKNTASVSADDFTIESTIVDSACMSVRLGINWTNGDLDLVLWDPNGNYYDSSVNSEYIKFISTGTSEYYEITAPTKGVWGLGVVGKDVRGDEEAFDYYAIANSSIEANLDFDATRVAPNQQISVNCIVKNGDNNVLDASVYAKVQDSKGNYEFVDLFDDGMHGDDIANDGVYGNIISKDTAGVYKVTGYVEGTATMGDVFYRQTVEEQFQVDVNAKASLISVMGNFGGDGKTAIVQYDYAKSLNVTGWFAQEDGSMKWQFINTVAPGWEISKMTGDFTGDGSDDIMWINKDSGHIGTWQMDNGSCKWSILTITDFNEWSLQGIGDFNGDGTDDMLFRNRLNGLVGILDTKNGEQVPGSWKVLDGTTDAWQIAGTGDFNGDKKDDILLTNTVTGQVGIWEMTAGGKTTWKSVSFTDFAEWRIQGIGDFNGDDVDDILFANNTTGVVGFWGMENGANKDWTLIGIADVKSDWQISGIGDFNDDGIDEIAWTSPTSERIGCWTQDKEKLAQWSILA